MNYFKEINGKRVFFTGVMVKEHKQIVNPTKEQLLNDGWQEYFPHEADVYVPTYEERVELLIRKKYSVSQEFAIQRQRDVKPDEFDEYFTYCEECKAIAKL